MKKYYFFLLSILSISFVSAEECSITNLASCISQSFFDFLLNLINAPIQPLLNAVYSFLTEPVNINLFSDIWAIIVYILSMFYGLLLIYVGFQFVFAGYSAEQREKAKSNLGRIIIMMVLVQSSFYLYGLAIDVFSSISAVILNLVPQNFFLLTIDNISNIGLQFVFLIPYLVSVLITLIILSLRYIIVSFGVIFFAIGIFLYFIEPLSNYGRLTINFLFITMSLTCFYSLVFLGCSKLLNISIFQNMKILVAISAFSLVNLVTILVSFFAIINSALKVASPVIRVVRLFGGL